MKTMPTKNVPRSEKPTMPTSSAPTIGLDHFFSAVAARHDRWRDLGKAAEAWACYEAVGREVFDGR